MPEQRMQFIYSISESEIENEVHRLYITLSEYIIKVNQIESSLNDSSPLSLENIKKLNSIREKLVSIDHRIEDIVNLVESYNRYKLNQASNENNQEKVES